MQYMHRAKAPSCTSLVNRTINPSPAQSICHAIQCHKCTPATRTKSWWQEMKTNEGPVLKRRADPLRGRTQSARAGFYRASSARVCSRAGPREPRQLSRGCPGSPRSPALPAEPGRAASPGTSGRSATLTLREKEMRVSAGGGTRRHAGRRG